MAHYISMFPADPDNASLRQQRVRICAKQAHAIGDPFPVIHGSLSKKIMLWPSSGRSGESCSVWTFGAELTARFTSHRLVTGSCLAVPSSRINP